VGRLALKVPPWRATNRRLQSWIDDRIASALEQTRIAKPRKVLTRYPHELSGGMKQRVMIGMALACRPELIIADEPTTALDVTTEVRILDLLYQLQEELGVAVLYISHNLGVVRRVSHRVLVMYAGQVVEAGPTEQVFREPKHPYTRALIEAMPSAEHARGTLRAIEGTVPELLDPRPSCPFSSRCAQAHDPCFVMTPQMQDESDTGHRVACFLYVDRDASSDRRQPRGAQS
jgi:oligopeptide/dipeptide ABC transporter ATP-binding protein